MSVTSSGYGAVGTNTPPLGLKIICLLNAVFSIIGFVGVLIIIPTTFTSGMAILAGVSAGLIITIVNLILVYYLYKLNKIAYLLFIAITGLNVIGSILSFNILTLLIQGLIFGYLLTIHDHF